MLFTVNFAVHGLAPLHANVRMTFWVRSKSSMRPNPSRACRSRAVMVKLAEGYPFKAEPIQHPALAFIQMDAESSIVVKVLRARTALRRANRVSSVAHTPVARGGFPQ